MEPFSSPPPPAPRSGKQVLLGLFVLWQLAFIVLINLLSMLSRAQRRLPEDLAPVADTVAPGWSGKAGHVHDAFNLVYEVASRYAEATGQTQSWALFSPNTNPHCVYPMLELHWDDDAARAAGPVTLLAGTNPLDGLAGAAVAQERTKRSAARPPVRLLSEHEPRDLDHYFRLGRMRLRKFETNLTLTLLPYSDEKEQDRKKRWRKEIDEFASSEALVVLAFLRWRLTAYQREHPGKGPPRWDGPHEERILRWEPAEFLPRVYQPLQTWDPVTESFERQRK
jgi:hypothetical protein